MAVDKSHNTPTALITGASVGIGYELAKQFAADGYHLVLVARNEKRLQERKAELEQRYGISAEIVSIDLSDPEASQQLWEEIQKRGIHVDVLVNNAGFGAVGEFAELDLQRQLDMIQVNVTALTALTHLFLPPMLERGKGGILNVASTAAFQPGPYMAVYYATKAYVLHFTEALAEELRGKGITVSALCPGATLTEFQERAGFRNVMLMKGIVMSAEAVARIGYRNFKRGRRVIITGAMNKLMRQSVRFTPGIVLLKVVKFLQKNRV